MAFLDRIEGFVIMVPIVVLLTIGLLLTLRSGVVSLGRGQGMWHLITNLSHMILFLGACLVGLVVIHQFVGLRVGLF